MTFTSNLGDFFSALRDLALSESGRHQPFFNDLQLLVAEESKSESGNTSTEKVLDFNLQKLGSELNLIRKQVISDIEKSPIDQDDPLACSISLFGTMDHGRMEKAHTQAIAWLMSDDSQHGFGNKLASAFLTAIGFDYDNDLQVKLVECERPFPSRGISRRPNFMDIFMQGTCIKGGVSKSWVLAVEAKIDSDLRDRQLEMIEEWIESEFPESEQLLIYLTTRVDKTAESKSWIPFSFEKLVIAFRRTYPSLKGCEGYYFLRYYLAGVLSDICGWPLPIDAKKNNPYLLGRYLKNI